MLVRGRFVLRVFKRFPDRESLQFRYRCLDMQESNLWFLVEWIECCMGSEIELCKIYV